MSSQALYGPAKRGFLHRVGRAGWTAGVAVALAGGCGMERPAGDAMLTAERASAEQVQPRGGARDGGREGQPPALVGNAAVTWEQLQPLMAEAAGGVVLEEVVLDRALEGELAGRGVEITAGDVERERGMLLRTLARAAGSSPDAAVEVLGSLRRARGLGERRFEALLRRNAGLRRLVRDEITITEADVQTGYEVQFGPKYRTRLIVTPSERAAAQALARLRGSGEAAAESFGAVAAEVSTDSSAARGGVIEPISPADPVYPAALRRAIAELKVGELSPVIGLEQGFAVVRLEEVIPGSGQPLEAVRGEVEAELRLIRERAAMDALAGRLLRSSPVIVLDRSLDWSWGARREQN